MSPSRARYVTACQQLLALGVVVMALVPATRVVSLDVVGVQPGQGVAQPTISVAPSQPFEDTPEFGMSVAARGKQGCAGHSVRVTERAQSSTPKARGCRERLRQLSVRTPAG